MYVYAKGWNGEASFDGYFVTIIRKGLVARVGVGDSEKRIPVGSVAAVQWKPASAALSTEA